MRLDLVLSKPVAHGGRTTVQSARHGADAEAFADQLDERLAPDSAAWGVANGVCRREPVLVDPVRDRRGVLVYLPRDRLDRLPGIQPGRQPVPVQEANTSSIGGRKGVH